MLTLLGNLFLIAANLLKVAMLETGIQSGSVGAEASYYLALMLQLLLLSCAGAILGALLMLAGKRLGFWIYGVSFGLHIILTCCAVVLWAMTYIFLYASALLLCYSIIPVVFFLYFYTHRAHLT
ncbi:MAG: hypothetical protein IPH63_15230 [Flavobacteriales bacterium]|nr:hypothetical protein [Flavobacteriales bacterium]